MIEIPRATFKTDPSYQPMYRVALKVFEVPKVALRLMDENRHVKGFMLQARQYFTLAVPGNDHVYVHCKAEVWWQDNKICATIYAIGIYESFLEYEAARIKDLHGADEADIPNIN
jgi:hypothetical protein